jgi:hypothetical protein
METQTQTIDLKPFCDPDPDSRYGLDEPWVVDGWRVATDGKVIVRVPATGEQDSPARDDGKRRPKQIRDILPPLNAAESDWQPWPSISPCANCMGVGKDTCETCNGSGTCDHCRCRNEHDCGDCDGEGLTTCKVCTQKGGLDHRFGVAEIALHYAHLISRLPSVSYLPATSHESALRFRFDGGEGAIMPLAK